MPYVEYRRQQVTVEHDGQAYIVALVTGVHDGEPFVKLEPVGTTNLEGELPGLYYLTRQET